MIWKAVILVGAALCASCQEQERRQQPESPHHGVAISEQYIRVEHRPIHVGHHGELAHIGEHAPRHHEGYAWSYPLYEFFYKVLDPHTHDHKGQHEVRDGDVVRGEYWLIEPDGNKRTVKYHADSKTGFKAEVHNSKPNLHIKPPQNEKPLVEQREAQLKPEPKEAISKVRIENFIHHHIKHHEHKGREPEKQEPERQEPEKQEPERREPERREPERQEPERQEPERQEPEKQNSERQESERQEPERQKPIPVRREPNSPPHFYPIIHHEPRHYEEKERHNFERIIPRDYHPWLEHRAHEGPRISEEPRSEGEEPRREEPRSKEPRRKEPKREELRREEPRREEPRREEPRREEPRREEPRREEPRPEEPRREEPRREEPWRKDFWRREGPRREEPRREEPRREEPRREEPRREEPRREEPRREEPRRVEPRREEPRREEPRREEPRHEEPRREEPRREEPRREELWHHEPRLNEVREQNERAYLYKPRRWHPNYLEHRPRFNRNSKMQPIVVAELQN